MSESLLSSPLNSTTVTPANSGIQFNAVDNLEEVLNFTTSALESSLDPEISESSTNTDESSSRVATDSLWILSYSLPELPIFIQQELEKVAAGSIFISNNLRSKIGKALFQSVSSKTL